MQSLVKTLVVAGGVALGGVMMSSASQAGVMAPAAPLAMDNAVQQVQWHHGHHGWGHHGYGHHGYGHHGYGWRHHGYGWGYRHHWHNHWRSRHYYYR